MQTPALPSLSSSAAPPVESVLVVGGGLAGFHVAHALRRQGFAGDITVVGAEPHAPYDRPPLSKAFLAGTIGAADLALDDADDPLDVTWVRGVGAEYLLTRPAHDSLDGRARHGIRTTDGRDLVADAVVIATGATPIRLGPPVTGTHVLRTLEDAEALRADGVAGRDVVVVGTGFIGLEAAAAATALGAASVAVVGLERVPLGDRFGPEVGAAVQGLHERAGVRFHGGVTVEGLQLGDDARVSGVLLSDGRSLPGDLVVVGIGVRPATGWLGAPGQAEPPLALTPGGAVACDAAGRTSVAGVWAMGDCAQWSDESGIGHRRAGHWQDALDHAAVVAAGITGASAPVLADPYCWSDQHGITLQMAGHLDGTEIACVREGSIEGADLYVTFERDGVEVAVLGMNRMREVTRWRRTRTRARAATATSAA